MSADERLARDLSAALDDGAVRPFFQPIVSLDDGHILGLEVLARWSDPVHGQVDPARFIPIADRFGLLDRLLDHLMCTAFVAARTWPHNLFLGFNVSPTQLHDEQLAARVARAASEFAFPLSRVHIEVTESGFIDDLTESRRTLERLLNLGCMIAMDDFGTGYSSLTWLSTLPFSKIKIDASFVLAMTEHRQSRKIVAAVIGLGHSLGQAVVAEGVESPAQAELLRRMGCRLAQGYLFGRPSPAAEVAQLLGKDPSSRVSVAPATPMSPETRTRQLSERYRTDKTPIAFVDPSGTVVAASPAFAQMMAPRDAVATGRHIWELMAVTPATFAELRAIDLLGEPFPALEETTPGGVRALIMLRAVRTEDGELLGYLIMCTPAAEPEAATAVQID
ncbi:sensor domain-containing phosphodiesterase [Mycolicibacterium palauense]|uniref:sensor domain-containing phosphodiesterase n=1 Tax=Mycolicibacterium palauense TaxID=2034511 RepID=UPI00159BD833|nr:EAL domain-containing protein [Mycolicibacterium palauense]